MMTIRGWTVTLTSALAGFSLSQHHRSLLLVAMVATALFGLLDFRYRRTQLLHAARADRIEQVVRSHTYRRNTPTTRRFAISELPTTKPFSPYGKYPKAMVPRRNASTVRSA